MPSVKIAHVTSALCRSSAGLGVAVASISTATAQCGNDVRVFGLSSPGWLEGDSVTWSGAPAFVFDTSRWSGRLGYAREMLPSLFAFAPDIVHLHGLWTYPSIAVQEWHRKTGQPYVCSAHGMLISASLEYKRVRKKVARRLFQDRVLQAASVLHATSTDEETAYRDLGFNNRTELIPLGLDVAPPPDTIRDRPERRALFLGRLHHQKGIDWLIEAWTNLERDFPDWELSIVGPQDPDFAGQMKKIKQKANNTRVSFVGPLYGDAKYRYIAESDLIVMPSRSENFGLIAAESLMMEVPVIATKGTPWSGLVSANAGWWIEQGPSALEDAMRDAMRLPKSQLRKKGQNGRRWIEADFSWAVIAAKWQNVYESLLSPGPDMGGSTGPTPLRYFEGKED